MQLENPFALLRKLLLFLLLLLSWACEPSSNSSRVHDESSQPSEFDEASSGLPQCLDPTVQKVAMPKDHGNPTAGTFSYAYQIIRTPGARGTIIHIPGGPGQAAITDPERLAKLPQFSHILIDPRAVGCNADADGSVLRDELVTTGQHARDILFLIKELQLENYVLWGVSYGTIVATIVTDLAKQLPVPQQPRATILEGTLNAAVNEADFAQNFVRAWDLQLEQNPGLLEEFKDSAALPLGLPGELWESVLEILLSIGGKEADQFFQFLARESAASAKDKEAYAAYFQSLLEDNERVAPGAERFFQLVGCREVFAGPAVRGRLIDGRFAVLPLAQGDEAASEHCQERQLSNPFDANRYDLSQTPLYYFQGSADPNTPPAGALRHFEYHKARGQATFFEFADAGHNPLLIQLRACQAAVIEEIFQRGQPDAKLCVPFTVRR